MFPYASFRKIFNWAMIENYISPGMLDISPYFFRFNNHLQSAFGSPWSLQHAEVAAVGSIAGL
jgi:hypothetical protein